MLFTLLIVTKLNQSVFLLTKSGKQLFVGTTWIRLGGVLPTIKAWRYIYIFFPAKRIRPATRANLIAKCDLIHSANTNNGE